MNEYSPEKKAEIKEAFLKSLSQGVSIAEACEATGAERTTIWKWRKLDEEFDIQTNEILDSRVQVVEDALYMSAISDKNVTAQIFFLKNRSGGRWKDRQEIEHSGKINISDLTDEEIDDYISGLLKNKNIGNTSGEEKKGN